MAVGSVYDNTVMSLTGWLTAGPSGTRNGVEPPTNRISDHNRSPVQISVERIENSQRMANGRMRRYTVAKKYSWSMSWEMLPSRNGGPPNTGTVDGGMAGGDMFKFHRFNNGSFPMTLRSGQAINTPTLPDTTPTQTFTVMISEFSYEVTKRGPYVDLWTASLTLVEV